VQGGHSPARTVGRGLIRCGRVDAARMTATVLAVGHGALRSWKIVRKVVPDTREQRCWFHKQANVPSCPPESMHPRAIAALLEIWNAKDIDKPQVTMKAFDRHRPRRHAPVRGGACSTKANCSDGPSTSHPPDPQVLTIPLVYHLRSPGQTLVRDRDRSGCRH
jgi:hypothetical protein